MGLLNLLPPPLHRLCYRIAHRLRLFWWRSSRRTFAGCSVIVRDEQGRFLLVLHSYGPRVWTFPGGGMHKNETPLVAAMREVREELGCGLCDVRRLTTSTEAYYGATNMVHVFTALADGEPRADRREILEARFFARGDFPRAISRTVKRRLAAYDAFCAIPPWHELQKR